MAKSKGAKEAGGRPGGRKAEKLRDWRVQRVGLRVRDTERSQDSVTEGLNLPEAETL